MFQVCCAVHSDVIGQKQEPNLIQNLCASLFLETASFLCWGYISWLVAALLQDEICCILICKKKYWLAKMTFGISAAI